MAFPWLKQTTFDDGTLDGWDSETDVSSILDFPHYAEIARQGFAPWQGAHVMRARLNGTAVAHLAETTDFDTTAGNTKHVWFPVLIGADLSLTASDTVILFSLFGSAANEAVVGVRNNGGVYELFAGETGATRTLAITPSNSRWYEIELSFTIDSGGNDGTLDFYVDGNRVGAQITSLTQTAITEGRLGPVSGTAAGNTGTILYGGLILDDARVYPRRDSRFDTEKWITRDMTAWVGPGVLDAVSLTGTLNDAVMTILDTDLFESTGLSFSRIPSVYIRNVTNNDQSPGINTPVKFNKGCYVQLTGTNPQAFLSLRSDCMGNGVVMSHSDYVKRGLNRKGRI